MKSPEEMEKSLKRLMPAAISERAEQDICQMISSLACESTTAVEDHVVVSSAATPCYRNRLTWSAAAALLIGASVSLFAPSQPQSSVVAETSLPAGQVVEVASPVLIDRMEVTDSMVVEGTVASADGSVMNRVKRRVETRERYRDQKKGYLITISESRDVKELVPKTSF